MVPALSCYSCPPHRLLAVLLSDSFLSTLHGTGTSEILCLLSGPTSRVWERLSECISQESHTKAQLSLSDKTCKGFSLFLPRSKFSATKEHLPLEEAAYTFFFFLRVLILVFRSPAPHPMFSSKLLPKQTPKGVFKTKPPPKPPKTKKGFKPD